MLRPRVQAWSIKPSQALTPFFLSPAWLPLTGSRGGACAPCLACCAGMCLCCACDDLCCGKSHPPPAYTDERACGEGGCCMGCGCCSGADCNCDCA
ncbi:hypothetical protein FA09DRAFT_330566 [Tilletiopsis washingtonensis]|uniref:Uncharacterized protein n=1 Tax=Tilletiopsis washingtonensis TaxID=58919 RepID=A0A316Z758_9BASI|nr:hypothetical protein FA09DRAFT_330566 [Tilletiopsis washingtonensis]PWN97401.1 hypothetical protein FA09DRAFT_330566 [Tilletiopsis washingtonensis]